MKYQFDRVQWLRQRGYLDRRLLFLDLKFWILLREQNTPIQREMAKRLRERVEAGQVLCPVSPSLLMEVGKQKWSVKRNDYWRLMDDLSRGLSLRVAVHIFTEEMKCVLRGRPIPREVAYSHFLEAFGPGINLEFPEGCARSQADEIVEMLIDHMDETSILHVMGMVDEAKDPDQIDPLRTGLRELAAKDGRWRKDNHPSTREIEQAEFTATVQTFVPYMLPAMQEVGSAAIVTRWGTAPRSGRSSC